MPMSSIVGRVATLFVVLLVVTSMAGVGVAGAQAAEEDSDETDDVDAADEAYFTDDGEVVLVYRESGTDPDVSQVQFGTDVAIGLAHGFIEIEENTSEIEGSASVMAESDALNGSTDLAMAKPEELDSLSAEAELTQSDTERSFDGAIELDVNTTPREETATHTSNGTINVGADEFQISVDYAETLTDDRTNAGPRSIELQLEATEEGHAMYVDETRSIHPDDEGSWNTTEAANETLTDQYGALAASVNGTATVTVRDHEYADGTDADELDVTYEVTFVDVQDGIAEGVVANLADQSAMNLTDDERRALTEDVAAIDVRNVALNLTETETRTDLSVSVDVRDYEAAMVTFAEIAEARSDEAVDAEDVERMKATLDARADADLAETITWRGDLTIGQESTTLDAESSYESDNWAEYVDALEDRGIDRPGSVSVQLSAVGDGDEVAVESEFEVEREDLLNDTLAMAKDVLREGDGSDAGEAIELIETLERSGFEVARTDVSLADDTVAIEAGAQFEDIEELGNVSRAVFGGVPIEHVYAEGDSTEGVIHLYLSGDANVTESGLRDAGYVDDTTTVHESADISELPRMDTDAAGEYLGVDLPTETPEGGDDDDVATIADGQPGFGAVVALVALVVVALLGRRH